jgi:hypothetical protein
LFVISAASARAHALRTQLRHARAAARAGCNSTNDSSLADLRAEMTLQGVSSARPVAHCNSPRRLPVHGAAWGQICAAPRQARLGPRRSAPRALLQRDSYCLCSSLMLLARARASMSTGTHRSTRANAAKMHSLHYAGTRHGCGGSALTNGQSAHLQRLLHPMRAFCPAS